MTPKLVAAIVSIVADLLAYREQQTARGLSLAGLYNTLREPGRNILADLHRKLDHAVCDAYRFDAEDLLAQLLALNSSTAEAEAGDGADVAQPPGPPAGVTSRVTNTRLSPVT